MRHYFNGTEPTNLAFDYESDSLIILSFRTGRLIGNMSLGATYVGVSTLWDGKKGIILNHLLDTSFRMEIFFLATQFCVVFHHLTIKVIR